MGAACVICAAVRLAEAGRGGVGSLKAPAERAAAAGIALIAIAAVAIFAAAVAIPATVPAVAVASAHPFAAGRHPLAPIGIVAGPLLLQIQRLKTIFATLVHKDTRAAIVAKFCG